MWEQLRKSEVMGGRGCLDLSLLLQIASVACHLKLMGDGSQELGLLVWFNVGSTL